MRQPHPVVRFLRRSAYEHTATSIAGRMKLPLPVVRAALYRAKLAGLVYIERGHDPDDRLNYYGALSLDIGAKPPKGPRAVARLIRRAGRIADHLRAKAAGPSDQR